MDVREEGRHEEVQKGSQGAADWTLERREGIRKSKREAKVWWIGRWSGEKAVESPKEKQRRGGWTLKWREGSRKSKKTETSKFILTYKHSRYIIYNIVTYKLSRN